MTPKRIVYHLAKKHASHPSTRTSAQRAAIHDELIKVHPWNPDEEPFQIPPQDTPPIRGLPVYQGYRCLEEGCAYVARQTKSIHNHRLSTHSHLSRRRGRPSEHDQDQPTLTPVKCQRLFVAGAYSCYFEVLPAADQRRT